MPVNNRCSILLGEKRSILLTEIAEETGILYPTLLAWASNRVVCYEVSVIDALAKYFQIEDRSTEITLRKTTPKPNNPKRKPSGSKAAFCHKKGAWYAEMGI